MTFSRLPDKRSFKGRSSASKNPWSLLSSTIQSRPVFWLLVATIVVGVLDLLVYQSNHPSYSYYEDLLRLSPSAEGRVYPVWNADGSLPEHGWCEITSTPSKTATYNRPASRTGLLYVKNYKCGSSTGSGVTLQIAHNVARREFQRDPPFICPNSWDHIEARNGGFFKRHPEKSFLWTLVRHPAERALSEVYHINVGRQGMQPTDDNVIGELKQLKNRQVDYLMDVTENKTSIFMTTFDNPTAAMRKYILDKYNFIGITDRLDESLVVLQLLLGLPETDLIVLNSKLGGGYDDGGYNYTCHIIPKKRKTPQVAAYLEGEFPEHNVDFALYHMAVRSLDLTIDALGRQRVQVAVRRHRQLQALAESECKDKAVFPCSRKGVYQRDWSQWECYESDFGCGYKCVNQVMDQVSRGEIELPRP